MSKEDKNKTNKVQRDQVYLKDASFLLIETVPLEKETN